MDPAVKNMIDKGPNGTKVVMMGPKSPVTRLTRNSQDMTVDTARPSEVDVYMCRRSVDC